jgi:hypothetical protein
VHVVKCAACACVQGPKVCISRYHTGIPRLKRLCNEVLVRSVLYRARAIELGTRPHTSHVTARDRHDRTRPHSTLDRTGPRKTALDRTGPHKRIYETAEDRTRPQTTARDRARPHVTAKDRTRPLKAAVWKALAADKLRIGCKFSRHIEV